ncbi:MAG: phosphotransferase, partial [Gammaproteobacteria bacterium]
MTAVVEPANPPAAVLEAYALSGYACERITSGHINLTWKLTADPADTEASTLVLQRVNRIFAPEAHHDIVRVTDHLRRHGIETIELLPTRTGEPFLEHAGEIWRVTRFIEGATSERVRSAH